MLRATTRAELRRILDARPGRIGFVPTMGFLHEGHLSLVDRARARADTVVLSVYVNPLQFGPAEDLARYPRDLERDAALAAARGVDVLFAPTDREIYPRGAPAVRIAPGPLAERLCGRHRPGHFEGVLTVVAKLFHLVRPHLAVFGQKDYQQAVLVRRMVEDLDFPVTIDVAPTVREPDGLALSSRNTYLSPAERVRARALFRGLSRAAQAFEQGERGADALSALVRRELEADDVVPQYIELVHPETLEPVPIAEPGSVLAVAAFVGAARLIDNVILGGAR